MEMISIIAARHLPALINPLLIFSLLLPAPLLAQTNRTAVIVAPVQQAEVIEEVPLTGTVIASQQARLSTEINGLIDVFQVDIGDRVNKGDVILRLKSQFDRLVLQARQADLEQARQELEDAKRRLADAERLGRSNTVSVNEINSLKSEVSIDSAAVSRLLAEEKQQQLRVRQHTLQAPFSGIISDRMAEQGEWVDPGQPVVELVSLNDLMIEFQTPQRIYQRLDSLVRFSVQFDVIPGQSFPAEIKAVAPVTNRSSRTFLIRAISNAGDIRLIPGISSSATLHLRDSANGVVVDRNALIRYPDGRVSVWIAKEVDGRAVVTEKQVKTGLSFNGRVNIIEGLEVDEYVVVNGNESLREGQSVIIKRIIE